MFHGFRAMFHGQVATKPSRAMMKGIASQREGAALRIYIDAFAVSNYSGHISDTIGSTILGPSTISNISSRVSTFDPGSGQWIYNYFPGDYHEIWRHNYPDGARWNDVWIARVLNTNGDLYVTDVR